MKSFGMIILTVLACLIAVVQAGFLPKLTAQDKWPFVNHQAIPIVANSGEDVHGRLAKNIILTAKGCTDKLVVIAKNINLMPMNLTPKKDFNIATWDVECNVCRKEPKEVILTLSYDIYEGERKVGEEKDSRKVFIKYHKPYDRSESMEKPCKKDSKSCKKDSKSCKKDSKSCKKDSKSCKKDQKPCKDPKSCKDDKKDHMNGGRDENNHRPPMKTSHKKDQGNFVDKHHEDSRSESGSSSDEKTSKKKTTHMKRKTSMKKKAHKGKKGSSSSGAFASMTFNKFLFIAGVANAILFLI